MKNKIVKGMIAASTLMAANAMAEEITVWAWDPNFNIAIMEKAAESYKQTHPDTTFKIIDFAKADVEQKLHTMLASGVTSSLPDIVLIEDYNSQKYLQSYPGSFAPMTGKVDYNNFAPYKVNLMTIDKEVYGLPFDTGVTGFYYRTDILAQAGFEAKDLENITWKRFIEIGQQVKEKTGIEMLGNDPSDMGLLRIMIQSAGSWYFDESGKLDIKDNKALALGIERFAQLHSTKIARPTVGWSEWVGVLTKGNVASITAGVWITPSVEAAPDQSGKWAIAPTPRLDLPGAKNSSNLGGSSWYVLNSSEEKDQAIDFLAKTFGSDTEFYGEILKERGAVGSYIPAGTTEAYQFESPFFNGQKIYADFNKWVSEIPNVNYGMYTYEVDSAIAAQMPGVIQGMPVEKALQNIEAQLKYQIR
ncbi:extracellular solute-binding protein [Vibrio sp. SS-MA-C1-2]|uniref:ABC transporter substrate-binding protein n=1 Tax=Vibrio sp. SS-MA-C1-2 TaxID=2908646 RepID=UPI001F1B67F6|nr:extracellular solute-binding protein [Vibrio sp. SS-MA-C1-2]UJF17963.1 extracellular solute-binding protein [Vibrio sp. SS-MA-C1-2]